MAAKGVDADILMRELHGLEGILVVIGGIHGEEAENRETRPS